VVTRYSLCTAVPMKGYEVARHRIHHAILLLASVEDGFIELKGVHEGQLLGRCARSEALLVSDHGDRVRGGTRAASLYRSSRLPS
jgi:hypothetical protein